MRQARRWVQVGPLLFVLSALGAAAAPPHRILVLHSFGRGIEPYETMSAAFRSALTESAPEPVEFREISLETAPFPDGRSEAAFVDYLRALDADRRIDLVVTIGGPAARFVQRNRGGLFSRTPLLIAGVVDRLVASGDLTPLDGTSAVRLDLEAAFENIFRLLPDTTRVVVVLGGSPVERFWKGEIEREFRPFAERAHLTFYDDLPFNEILTRAAALPTGTAIFYGIYAVDAEGGPHAGDDALVRLHLVAAAPIFGVFDSELGKGIAGGALIPVDESGRRTALAAIRILRGEAPAAVRPAAIVPGAPEYDWREIERWRIDPARLPAGSAIRFRPKTFWERNTWTVVGVSGIVGVEAVLIVVLLAALSGRRRAEEGLRRSREQYALAVDGANDGLWDWNVRTGDLDFSPRCGAMLGFEAGAMPGRFESWDERIHPDDRERVNADLEAHFGGRSPAFRVEHRLRHEDGSYRWILARGKAQRDAQGCAYRMAGSWSDVTERKTAEEAVRDVSGRLIVAQEEERARLARELHDDVTQRLARLAIDVGRVERQSAGTPPAETMRGVREGLVRLSEDVHALSYRLHPSLLEDLGLPDALQVECERFSGLSSVQARLELRDVPKAIPPGAAISLFRVAQEALRNVHRHAVARTVEVLLAGLDGGLQLAVRDDGHGFDPALDRGARSLGHASMRERIHLIGGEIDIESAPGQGTTVVAWVPLEGGRR